MDQFARVPEAESGGANWMTDDTGKFDSTNPRDPILVRSRVCEHLCCVIWAER